MSIGRFRPGLRMTALVTVVVPLAVALGFWQLHRAAEKRALEDARLANYGALPIDEAALDSAAPFTRVRVTGHYDTRRQFFVDNRTQHGVPGYVVVTPFDTVAGRRILVNRGWIAAPPLREMLPSAAPPEGDVRIEGMLWPDTTRGPRASGDAWSDDWPKRVEYLDRVRMAAAIGAASPTEFRLDDGQAGSLEPIVIGEEMTPARHVGYAVQWFGLAIAFAVAFVVVGIRHGK